jgi:hypothetical protein
MLINMEIHMLSSVRWVADVVQKEKKTESYPKMDVGSVDRDDGNSSWSVYPTQTKPGPGDTVAEPDQTGPHRHVVAQHNTEHTIARQLMLSCTLPTELS